MFLKFLHHDLAFLCLPGKPLKSFNESLTTDWLFPIPAWSRACSTNRPGTCSSDHVWSPSMWDMVDLVFSINVRRSRVDGCTPASHLLRKYVPGAVFFLLTRWTSRSQVPPNSFASANLSLGMATLLFSVRERNSFLRGYTHEFFKDKINTI